MTPPFNEDLGRFVAAGVLADTDVRIAARLARIGADPDPAVLLATALAVRAPRHGHVCVELDRVADHITVEPPGPGGDPRTASTDPSSLPWPRPEHWHATLAASPLVRGAGEGSTPLVLEGGRLYLDRYWGYERRLADALHARARRWVDGAATSTLSGRLDELFGRSEGLDRQRLAAAVACLRHLTVIAGGPGTGKTYTVARILALLHAEADDHGHPPPRAVLAAPTGKAAARLQESLTEGAADLDLADGVRDALAATPASTVHRLLGVRRGSSTRFRHSADDPLPHDLVIVDEASMISLPLMAKLVDAVGDHARLVLLGDRDQLASVEAGAVFGDLCGPTGSRPLLQHSVPAIEALQPWFATDLTDHITALPQPGVWDTVIRLDRFRRFGRQSHLGAVAAAMQREDIEPGGTLTVLRRGPTASRTADPAPDPTAGSTVGSAADPTAGDDHCPDHPDGVRHLNPRADPDARQRCEDDVVAAYTEFARLAVAEDPDPVGVLAALASLRVLCALRRGPSGTRAWNRTIEERLRRRVDGFLPGSRWYAGRPVLITRNDYGVRLYNGDVGVILRDRSHRDRHVAVFGAPDGTLRFLSPARLPECETTFAMTVHKSQGSQFDHAVVVLPETSSPILTRELVYTAVTRARHRTTLLADEAILREAIARPVQRATGLQQRLWGATGTWSTGAGMHTGTSADR